MSFGRNARHSVELAGIAPAVIDLAAMDKAKTTASDARIRALGEQALVPDSATVFHPAQLRVSIGQIAAASLRSLSPRSPRQ